jgi:hypothetical protein
MFALAASEVTTGIVKGNVLLKINNLERELQQRLAAATNVGEQANLTFLLHQMRRFREKPETFKPAPGLGLPPGQPIGCGEE